MEDQKIRTLLILINIIYTGCVKPRDFWPSTFLGPVKPWGSARLYQKVNKQTNQSNDLGNQAAEVNILWFSLRHQFFISQELKFRFVHFTFLLTPKSECLLDISDFWFKNVCFKKFPSSHAAFFKAPDQQESSFRCLTKTETLAVLG